MDPVLKSPVLSEDQTQPDSPENSIHQTEKQSTKQPPPLLAKLTAILLISCISFGSHWYSSVTSAMKSTLKKELHISNTQFSLLEASEDFLATVLLPFSGLITDRFGGANMIVYGNIIYTLGSILVAAAATVESYKFMIGSRVILAFGDIATQIAQYKMFSSWFSPSNGFASTVGFELAIGKLGGFAGQSTANIIAKKTGHFYWTFWVAVFMNLFTNASTALFWIFSRYCEKRYIGRRDTATNEHLTEKNRNFELKKVFQLPWTFWAVLSFSLFQTSAAVVFSQNSTELAEKRFNVSSIKAGWYSALSQYTGFFLVPCLGVLIDILGNRATVMCICGIGMLLCMCLVNFADTSAGTAASFGIYAVAVSFGPVSIIDSIRAVLYHQSVFGSAYSLKVTMNNAMNIIIRIITGALQDADNDSYRRAVRVYLFQAAASVVVGLTILIGSFFVDSLAVLQWTRKYRLKKGGDIINSLKEKSTTVHLVRNRRISIVCFGMLSLLIVGSWVAYIWGAVTGHNS